MMCGVGEAIDELVKGLRKSCDLFALCRGVRAKLANRIWGCLSEV